MHWVLSTALGGGGMVKLGQGLLMDDSTDLVKPHHQKSRFSNKLLQAFIPKEETKENQMTRISNCRMFWLSNLNRDILCNGEAGWCPLHILFFGVWTKPALPGSWQVESTPGSTGTRKHSTFHSVPALDRGRTAFTVERIMCNPQQRESSIFWVLTLGGGTANTPSNVDHVLKWENDRLIWPERLRQLAQLTTRDTFNSKPKPLT